MARSFKENPHRDTWDLDICRIYDAIDGMRKRFFSRRKARIWQFGFILCLFLCPNVSAKEAIRNYPARILSCYDADTCTVMLDLGLGIFKMDKVRINGVDTPEIRTKSDYEKDLALKAKEFTVNEILNEEVVIVEMHKREKFGRILGDILYGDPVKRLSEQLIEKGHAREYHGEKRLPWIDSEEEE